MIRIEFNVHFHTQNSIIIHINTWHCTHTHNLLYFDTNTFLGGQISPKHAMCLENESNY